MLSFFDGSNGKPVLNMLEIISENYEGDEKTHIDKDGDEIVNWYRALLVGRNACGFDTWVVLNALVKEIPDLKREKPLGHWYRYHSVVVWK